MANGVEYNRNIEYRGSQSQSGKDLYFYLDGLRDVEKIYIFFSPMDGLRDNSLVGELCLHYMTTHLVQLSSVYLAYTASLGQNRIGTIWQL